MNKEESHKVPNIRNERRNMSVDVTDIKRIKREYRKLILMAIILVNSMKWSNSWEDKIARLMQNFLMQQLQVLQRILSMETFPALAG